MDIAGEKSISMLTVLIIIIIFFLAELISLWDLSSPIRD